MADKVNDQEVQAAAILYLLDSGHEDLANTLLACRVTINYYSRHSIDYVEIAGRHADLDALVNPHRRSYDPLIKESVFEALKRAVPGEDIPYNSETRIKLRAVVSVPTEYQQATRKLVESAAGANNPVIGGLRVRQAGREYQLKPISIFPVGTYDRDPNLCFVMMPFAPQFQPIYERGIKAPVQARGLTCRRGDDILQPGDVLAQIWTSLVKASVVIADLSGSNGNVLYELGLAHMMGHQAILLAQDISSVPFDLRQQRHVIYSPTDAGIAKLVTDLSNALDAFPVVKPTDKMSSW